MADNCVDVAGFHGWLPAGRSGIVGGPPDSKRESMSKESRGTVLRLRKRHEPGAHGRPTAEDGERLVRAQSVLHGAVAGLVAVVVFDLLWVLVTNLQGRILPWLMLLLGVVVGLAVRRGGQGFDWRFPVLAAVLTLAGALAGMVLIAAGTTATELETNTWTVLSNVTLWTWPVFFDEVLTAADYFYAGTGAAIAAWFSFRRLDRREFHAVRLYHDR